MEKMRSGGMQAPLVELFSELLSSPPVVQAVAGDPAFLSFLVDECCLPCHLSKSAGEAAFLCLKLSEDGEAAKRLLRLLMQKAPDTYGDLLGDPAAEHGDAQTNLISFLLALIPYIPAIGHGNDADEVVTWFSSCATRLKPHLLASSPSLLLATVIFLNKLLRFDQAVGNALLEAG